LQQRGDPALGTPLRRQERGIVVEEDPMPHIPYVDPSSVIDPEILGYLERARREGTPRPESQAIRANNPSVIRAFSQAWELTFRQGVCDHALKELCRVYVSKSIECEY